MMFKTCKRRVERFRSKAHFRLQFKASRIPQEGWDNLCVNLVPVGTKKIVAKTEKASIHDGICQWSEPIHETISVEQDATTGEYAPSCYNLVVSTGASWYGFLGEASVNLSDFLGFLKARRIDLPLKGRTETVLHVTIQQIAARSEDWDHEGHYDGSDRMHVMASVSAEDDTDESIRFSESTSNGHGSEVNYLTSLKEMSPGSSDQSPRHVKSGGHHRRHSVASSSSSSYSDKQERSTLLDMNLKKTDIPQDPLSFLSSISQNAKKNEISQDPVSLLSSISQSARYAQSNNDYGRGYVKSTESTSNAKFQNWIPNQTRETAHRGNDRLKEILKSYEETIEELQGEVKELQSEVSSLERREARRAVEMDDVKRQLSKEVQQVKDFETEISIITAERDDIRAELEQLKVSKSDTVKTPEKRSSEFENSRQIIEELRQELEYEKHHNHDITIQLQKTQESNSELLFAIQELETMLDQKDQEIESLSSKPSNPLTSEQMNFSKLLENDAEMDWMQNLSYSEQILKGLVNKAGFHLKDDLNSLETALHDARQDIVSIFYKLRNELNANTEKTAQFESDLHNLLEKVVSSDTKEQNLKRENQYPEDQHFSVKEDNDVLSQLENAWIEVLNQNQKLRDELMGCRKEIKNLERQFQMVDEEAQVLAEANQQLEGKLEMLEQENQELRTCLDTSEEAGREAQEQIQKLMDEAALFSRKSETGNETLHDMEEPILEADFEGRENGNTAWKQIVQLKYKISDLERELQQEKEKNGSNYVSNERNESVLNLESRIIRLSEEAEDYKKARDLIVKELEELEEEYETLKQEHEKCSQPTEDMRGELRSLKQVHEASLSTISTLESKIKDLERDIDLKSSKFSEDLNALMLLKMEQEQKAKTADEALRKTRWDNAVSVERIQENFRKISQQMQSTFQAKENLATQALQEASELRLEKASLQDLLKKAEDEAVSLKSQFEMDLQEMKKQLDISNGESEKLSADLQNTLAELEKQKQGVAHNESQIEQMLSKIDGLKEELQICTNEKNVLLEKVNSNEKLKSELEGIKKDLDSCMVEKLEINAALQRSESERVKNEEEVGSLHKNLRTLKALTEEKEREVLSLESKLHNQASQISAYYATMDELSDLKSKHDELKNSLSHKDCELEDLKKEISLLKEEIQQKYSEFGAAERRHKDEVPKTRAAGGSGKYAQNLSKTGSASRSPKDMVELRRRIKSLEDEVESKRKALEESRQEVFMKDKELKVQTEEMEAMRHQIMQENHKEGNDIELENLKKQNAQLLKREKDLVSSLQSQETLAKEIKNLQKANEELHSLVSKYVEPAKYEKANRRIQELESEMAEASKEYMEQRKQLQSVLAKLETEINETRTEIERLRSRNASMEEELKDMRERYTSMSLKFAEVEGERQMLVMTIKGLKSGTNKR